MRATEKQLIRVRKIISHLGKEKVLSYVQRFYSNADIENLKKQEAQKIITGLDAKLPRKPIGSIRINNLYVK